MALVNRTMSVVAGDSDDSGGDEDGDGDGVDGGGVDSGDGGGDGGGDGDGVVGGRGGGIRDDLHVWMYSYIYPFWERRISKHFQGVKSTKDLFITCQLAHSRFRVKTQSYCGVLLFSNLKLVDSCPD